MTPMRTNVCRRGLTLILGAAIITAGSYFIVGEFLPQPLAQATKVFSGLDWARQQVLLLAALSLLSVLLASIGGRGSGSFTGFGFCDAYVCLAVVNVVPLTAAVVTTWWSLESDNCPYSPFEGAPEGSEIECDYLATVLDVVGVASARLARFDLGICILLATRGESGWLLKASGGWLGLPEAMPLHRAAGWWCAGQGTLHSLAYLIFYPQTGGWRSLWLNCFPVSTEVPGVINRLGLVNFFGVVAFVAMLLLVVPALPAIRRRWYHVFHWLHLPSAVLFVICCALHDLPILLFAVPGIADWYLGRRNFTAKLLQAKVRLLPCTSGPWVELTIDWLTEASQRGDCGGRRQPAVAPRGEWALLRVLPLGREMHPLSVSWSASSSPLSSSAACTSNAITATRSAELPLSLRALIAGGAGDWSRKLADLSRADTGTLAVEMVGPFRAGGGDWSLSEEPALLLVAGGTGVFGWLPMLGKAGCTDRYVHLVWCVKTEGDYLALAEQLPLHSNVHVTVFVTRAAESTATATGAGELPVPFVESAVQVNDTPNSTGGGGGAVTSPDAHSHKPMCSPTNRKLDVGSGVRQRDDHVREAELGIDIGSGRPWRDGRGPDATTRHKTESRGPEEERASDGADDWLVWASLSASFIGLAVGFWGWIEVEEELLEAMRPGASLVEYTVGWRSLPIALILASVGMATAAGSSLCKRFACAKGGAASSVASASLRDASGPCHRANDAQALLLVGGQETGAAWQAEGLRGESVWTGRPDLLAVVRAAAAAAATRNGTKRLVVAACGPAQLVGATRSAVRDVRKERCRLRLVFSGTDSTW